MSEPKYQRLAFEMQLYYDGFPDGMLDRMHRKLNLEKERLKNIQSEAWVDTFEKFIDYSEVSSKARE